MYPNLSADITNEQRLGLNKINEVKHYFIIEIRERKLMIKNLSKYIASFEYFNKSLIFLFVLASSISIAPFVSVIGASVGIVGASCGLTFSIESGFIKSFSKTTRNKNKKHNKIVMLARSKLNSIESKISKGLMDNEISHEDKKNIEN